MRFDPILRRSALLCLAIFAASVLLLLSDSTQILGINRWIKPSKFALSGAIYLGTMAVFVAWLPPATAIVSRIRSAFALILPLEIGLIVMQAARARRSHFNFETPLDSAIFLTMGVAITINTWYAARLLWLYWKNPPALPGPLLAAVRYGLAIFVFASLLGNHLSAQKGHTVGAPDGGPGLPYVNWSATHGDLRVAHFLGLHAIQALPLLAWLTRSVTLVRLSAAAWLVLMLAAWVQALLGVPLVRWQP